MKQFTNGVLVSTFEQQVSSLLGHPWIYPGDWPDPATIPSSQAMQMVNQSPEFIARYPAGSAGTERPNTSAQPGDLYTSWQTAYKRDHSNRPGTLAEYKLYLQSIGMDEASQEPYLAVATAIEQGGFPGGAATAAPTYTDINKPPTNPAKPGWAWGWTNESGWQEHQVGALFTGTTPTTEESARIYMGADGKFYLSPAGPTNPIYTDPAKPPTESLPPGMEWGYRRGEGWAPKLAGKAVGVSVTAADLDGLYMAADGIWKISTTKGEARPPVPDIVAAPGTEFGYILGKGWTLVPTGTIVAPDAKMKPDDLARLYQTADGTYKLLPKTDAAGLAWPDMPTGQTPPGYSWALNPTTAKWEIFDTTPATKDVLENWKQLPDKTWQYSPTLPDWMTGRIDEATYKTIIEPFTTQNGRYPTEPELRGLLAKSWMSNQNAPGFAEAQRYAQLAGYWPTAAEIGMPVTIAGQEGGIDPFKGLPATVIPWVQAALAGTPMTQIPDEMKAWVEYAMGQALRQSTTKMPEFIPWGVNPPESMGFYGQKGVTAGWTPPGAYTPTGGTMPGGLPVAPAGLPGQGTFFPGATAPLGINPFTGLPTISGPPPLGTTAPPGIPAPPVPGGTGFKPPPMPSQGWLWLDPITGQAVYSATAPPDNLSGGAGWANINIYNPADYGWPGVVAPQGRSKPPLPVAPAAGGAGGAAAGGGAAALPGGAPPPGAPPPPGGAPTFMPAPTLPGMPPGGGMGSWPPPVPSTPGGGIPGGAPAPIPGITALNPFGLPNTSTPVPPGTVAPPGITGAPGGAPTGAAPSQTILDMIKATTPTGALPAPTASWLPAGATFNPATGFALVPDAGSPAGFTRAEGVPEGFSIVQSYGQGSITEAPKATMSVLPPVAPAAPPPAVPTAWTPPEPDYEPWNPPPLPVYTPPPPTPTITPAQQAMVQSWLPTPGVPADFSYTPGVPANYSADWTKVGTGAAALPVSSPTQPSISSGWVDPTAGRGLIPW